MTIDFNLDIAELRTAPYFTRGDLTLYGLDHSGPSYQIRVYFNPAETKLEDPSPAAGIYAGGISVFGHGGCAGDEGHCHPRGPITTFDRTLPHQLTPASKNIICTDALRQAITTGPVLHVRLIPILRTSPFVHTGSDPDRLLTVTEISLHAYA